MKSFGQRIMQAARIMVGVGTMLAACTSARDTEISAPVPTTINNDADRKAIYNNGTATRATPATAPRNLNDQASETNRQKTIERRGSDKSSTRPLEVRTEELGRPPVDTIRRGL